MVYGKYEKSFEVSEDMEHMDEVQTAVPESESTETENTEPEGEESENTESENTELESTESENTELKSKELESTGSESTESTETYTQENSQQTTEPDEDEMEKAVSLFPENFQGVLFIGDSRTVGLYEYGQLKEADTFADSGMSVFNLWSSEIMFDNQKITLEQLLSENHYQTIHFMLGINELGYSMERIVEKYRDVVKEIQNLQPQANIVLGANLHVTEEKSAAGDIYSNQKINKLNGKIESISRELNCYYIDINEKFDDKNGNLSKEYSADGSHILGKYYADWVHWLQDY